MGCSLGKLVFRPPTTTHVIQKAEKIAIDTDRGYTISAVFCRKGADVTILLSHGNAEDLGRVEEWVREVLLPRISANVFIYEYTGYGQSEVSPREELVYSDCDAALSFLRDEEGIPLQRIILYGRSIGSGPSCYLAERYPQVRGLILQSPIASVLRVIFDFRFTLPGDMFPNIDRMERILCPVLILHGSRDEIVPFSHPEQLLQRCSNGNKLLLFVEGAGHNDLEIVAGPTLFEEVQKFINSLE